MKWERKTMRESRKEMRGMEKYGGGVEEVAIVGGKRGRKGVSKEEKGGEVCLLQQYTY